MTVARLDSICVRGALCVALALVAVGCGSGATIAMQGEFPKPVIAPLPLHVGLVLNDALTGYVHDEEIKGLGHWHIEVGQLQRKLFRDIVTAMFDGVTEVPSPEVANSVDGVLVPSIVDFQISIPAQTRSDFYEVWIKYSIRLYDAGGGLVVEWPLTAYGKASQGDYSVLKDKDRPGMHDATMVALRDAGAFLSLRFAEVPEVKKWLAAHSAEGN
jgi:hypothetical protein